MSVIYHKNFSLNWTAMAAVRQVLRYVMSKFYSSEESIDAVGTAMTEYIANLIKHGQGLETIASLTVSEVPKGLIIEFADKTPFYADLYERVDIGVIAVNDGELKTGGMGLGLIKTLFPDFQYHRHDDYNRFAISVDIKPRHAKVVFVDDDELILSLMQHFASCDYQVSGYTDPDTALEAMLLDVPDLIVLDIQMPAISGIDYREKLKRFESLADVPVVFLSGEVDEQIISAACDSAVEDYLAKPVNKETLLRVIRRVLKRNCLQVKASRFAKIDNTPMLCGPISLSAFGSAVMNLSGDFLLHYADDNGVEYLVLGDVMGHDQRAQQEARQIRSFLLGLLAAGINCPETLFGRLSKALFSDLLLQQSTMTCLVLKIDKREISWISAGHPLPVLIDANLKLTELGPTQALPGLNQSHQYIEQSFELKPMQHLLLYTDGWFENEDKTGNGMTKLKNLIQYVQLDEGLPAQIWRLGLNRLSQEEDDASLLLLG